MNLSKREEGALFDLVYHCITAFLFFNILNLCHVYVLSSPKNVIKIIKMDTWNDDMAAFVEAVAYLLGPYQVTDSRCCIRIT